MRRELLARGVPAAAVESILQTLKGEVVGGAIGVLQQSLLNPQQHRVGGLGLVEAGEQGGASTGGTVSYRSRGGHDLSGAVLCALGGTAR